MKRIKTEFLAINSNHNNSIRQKTLDLVHIDCVIRDTKIKKQEAYGERS